MTAASKPPRSGRVARSAIAGGALARAGVARLGHKARDLARDEAQRAAARAAHEAELGRILFGALNQLKGVALKAAQLLSSEAQLLPQGLREQLARACYQATPMNQALVGKRMRQALGPDWAERFAHFEPQAFAAASLGQVHRAQLEDGRALALKLQYPGIAATISSDMRLLRSLLLGRLGGLALGEGALPDAALLARVLDEIEAGLATELDYAQEARAMDEFRAALAPRLPQLVVPEVCHALSTPQLLAMQALPGQHLAEWLAQGPSQAERDRYGQLIFETFMLMVFELGRLHADPHPGNYLFMPDGRLGLLDFGCTRVLPPRLVEGLARAWSAALVPDGDAALHSAYQALGLIDASLDLASFRRELRPALAPLLDWQLAPFREPVFDFGARAPLPHLGRAQQRVAVRHLHDMPPELPYLDRAFLGLNQLLAQLGARVRTRNPWIGGEER
jgi:predicted unusual protein kinase regulating ubiquinone biosynthesis (AarF/ABC1/UbiB family)